MALQDVTSMFTVLTVAGPKSRDLMQQLTNSNLEMHPFTYKYVNMGYASGVLVLAVTQVLACYHHKRNQRLFFMLNKSLLQAFLRLW